MQGRDDKGTGRHAGAALAAIGACAVLGLTATAAAGQTLTTSKSKVVRSASEAPRASAAKKKGKKPVNTTGTGQIGFAAGTAVTSTAECPGKTHATGGGFAVSPNFTPTPPGGLRSMNMISFPSGPKSWTAGGGAFNPPPAATGAFTSHVRCESTALGKVVATLNISGTVAPGTTTTALIDCPGGTHVLGGGFAGTGLGSFAFAAASTRTIILESRRSNINQWTVVAYTNSFSPVAAPFTAYALCERNNKGTSVTEASTLAPVGDNVRTTGDATCTGKRHVVSGGFAVTDGDPTGVPAVGIDENHPVDKKGWHVGMWEFPPLGLPGGTAVQTFAYCKKNSPPKKKSKK